jgi:hypothetical protein
LNAIRPANHLTWSVKQCYSVDMRMGRWGGGGVGQEVLRWKKTSTCRQWLFCCCHTACCCAVRLSVVVSHMPVGLHMSESLVCGAVWQLAFHWIGKRTRSRVCSGGRLLKQNSILPRCSAGNGIIAQSYYVNLSKQTECTSMQVLFSLIPDSWHQERFLDWIIREVESELC